MQGKIRSTCQLAKWKSFCSLSDSHVQNLFDNLLQKLTASFDSDVQSTTGEWDSQLTWDNHNNF